MIDSRLKRIQELGARVIHVTEEMLPVYYRGGNYLVNKSGTVVLSPFTHIQSNYEFAIYNGQLYFSRKVYDDQLHKEIKVTGFGGKYFIVARLVLLAFKHFIKNEENRTHYVKYLDGDYHNCHIDNLQWQPITDFRVNQEIKRKGFCIKSEAKKHGLSRLTLQSRLKSRNGDMSASIKFDRLRNHTAEYGYFVELSRSTGINIHTLISRYKKGDRGIRLVRKPRALKNHV